MAGPAWSPAGSARAQPRTLDRLIVIFNVDQQPEVLDRGEAAMPATATAEGNHAAVQDVGAELRQRGSENSPARSTHP